MKLEQEKWVEGKLVQRGRTWWKWELDDEWREGWGLLMWVNDM